MSDSVQVVYFMGCPNTTIVFDTLKANEIPFGLVIQDGLAKDDPRRRFSSPTILVNGTPVIGSATPDESASCTLTKLTPDSIMEAIKTRLAAG